tara:strand:+ start:2283 stop:2687 length:405 start_codon:yes stop_codon:yes gene_type:complete
MRLRYSEQNKGSLAIVDNWTLYKYGLSSNEIILPYEINVMSKLNFIYHSDMDSDYRDIIRDCPIIHTKFKSRGPSLKLLVTRGWFHYKGRVFAIPNKSFEKFLKNMKKRYQRKIALKKNPINLRHREIMGKFKF